MVENENQTADEQEDVTETEEVTEVEESVEGAKIAPLTLSVIEETVTEYSRAIAAQYRVKPHQYRIHLTTKCKGIMAMRRGPVVQIALLWPDAGPQINTLLKDAFHLISTRPMIDSWAVEPVAVIVRRGHERRKFFREKFGDECEIFADLLPRRRLRKEVEIQRTLTMTDKDTGISVSVTYDGETRTTWDAEQEARIKLSRVVRAFEIAEALKVTPESEGGNEDHGITEGALPSNETDAQ